MVAFVLRVDLKYLLYGGGGGLHGTDRFKCATTKQKMNTERERENLAC